MSTKITYEGIIFMDNNGIIFDLDGTLWDSAEGICGTWRKVIENYPQVKCTVTVDVLYGCMGLPLDEIGRRLFPELDSDMQEKLMDECCRLENEYLAEHGGMLYPDLEETLEYLSYKYRLFIVSNCQTGYIESFFKAHGLGKYFDDIECFGATGLSKGENNKLIIERNNIISSVYVGDTQGDADSATVAGIPFVYARYGFGDVEKYDYVIDKISDMIKIM